MYAIQVNKLHKSYGKSEVLKGINLEVKPGSLFALLGPNGAGKTTIVRILATLLQFNMGTAKIFGYDVVREAAAVRQQVSLTGQFASLDEDLTGVENLVLVARLLGYSWAHSRARAAELLHTFDLEAAAQRQVKHYSGGMRRRLDIAASIIVAPELLFLDEPTTGLDPRSQRHIWALIRSLRAAGTTVLLTTQYMEEADALADRIVILDQGTIIADGTPAQLKASLGAGTLKIQLSNTGQKASAEQIIQQTLGLETQADAEPHAISVALKSPQTMSNPEQLKKTMSALWQAEIGVSEFSLEKPSLAEVFLTLTGQPIGHETVTEKEATA